MAGIRPGRHAREHSLPTGWTLIFRPVGLLSAMLADGLHIPTRLHVPGTIRGALVRLLRCVTQAVLLWTIFAVAVILVQTTRLPLPPNLVGLLLLLLLLSTGILRPAQLQETSALVSRHLAFFFVPFAVGLMSWASLFATAGLVLILCLLGSAVIGLFTAGVVAQCLLRRSR